MGQVQIKAAPIAERKFKRKVILVSQSCCGCGCSDIELERVVDNDSPLKSGDRIKISEMLPTDKVI